MKIGSVLGSYLKCEDLGGKRIRVTMDRVDMEKLNDEEKPVLYFLGKNKGLVLNKTNADSIIGMVGTDETDDWHGVQIIIHPDKTMFAGKKVDCIRIASPIVAAAKPPKAPPPPLPADDGDGFGDDSEIPFAVPYDLSPHRGFRM